MKMRLTCPGSVLDQVIFGEKETQIRIPGTTPRPTKRDAKK
jgi:hypothetical protein